MTDANGTLIMWSRDRIGTPPRFMRTSVNSVAMGSAFAHGIVGIPSLVTIDSEGTPRWFDPPDFSDRPHGYFLSKTWTRGPVTAACELGCVLANGEFHYRDFSDPYDPYSQDLAHPGALDGAKVMCVFDYTGTVIYIGADDVVAWFDPYEFFTGEYYEGGTKFIDDFPDGLKAKQIALSYIIRDWNPEATVAALGMDGRITVWGEEQNPVYDVPENLVAESIAVGFTHALAIEAGGSVVAWGDNTHGQCAVPTGLVASKVFAGDRFSGALLTDGSVVMWGDYPEPPPGLRATDIEASCDTVVAIGSANLPPIVAGIEIHNNVYPQAFRPPGREKFVEVATARSIAIGRREDGTVAVWGDGTGYGEVPDAPEGLVARKVIAAVGSLAAITEDGNLIVWGEESVPPGTAVKDAWGSHGSGFSAILDDNTVVCFGFRPMNWWNGWEFDVPQPEGLKAVKVVIGDYHALALKDDGTVIAWGHEQSGSIYVPEGLIATDIAAGSEYSAALKPDGTVEIWGNFTYPHTELRPWHAKWAPFGKRVVAIDGGHDHIVGRCEDGTVVAWGNNRGRYGQGVPIEGQCDIPPGTTAASFCAGYCTTFLVNEDQTVRQYGYGNYYIDEVPPGVVPTDVSMGGTHILALDSKGKVWAWGNNVDGQCNVPQGLVATKISAGERHSLALGRDGRVYAWGENSYGQCDVPPGMVAVDVYASELASYVTLPNKDMDWFGGGPFPSSGRNKFATQISCSDVHGLIVRGEGIGIVDSWGSNDDGERDFPPNFRAIKVAAGDGVSLAIDTDGHMVEVGRGSLTARLPAGAKYVDVDVSGSSFAAITEEHELELWWYIYVL